MAEVEGKIDRRLLRTRIGEPGSTIMPGDPTPGGGVYRGGQFAPTMDELSSLSLIQARDADLLSRNLPIYDESGQISEELISQWKPELEGVHISPKVPKYSSAVLVDTLDGRGITKLMNLTRIEAGERYEQDQLSIYGETIILSKFTSDREFTGKLVVFPSFYKYVSIPMMGPVPGQEQGLSVASYAVFHALGHLMFSRLMHDGKISKVSALLESADWSKNTSNENLDAGYLHYKNTETPWKRGKNIRNMTEASKFTPMDYFAEMFAFYYTNRKYLESVFPDRYEMISNVLEEYKNVL